MKDIPVSSRQWLVLIGAMLASAKVREKALQCFDAVDIPGEILPLWKSIEKNNSHEVRMEASKALMVPFGQSGTVDALIQALREHVLTETCRSVARKADMSLRAGTVDEVIATLESALVAIQSRKDKLAASIDTVSTDKPQT